MAAKTLNDFLATKCLRPDKARYTVYSWIWDAAWNAAEEKFNCTPTSLQQRLNAIADVLECLHDGDNVSSDSFVRSKLAIVRGNCT